MPDVRLLAAASRREIGRSRRISCRASGSAGAAGGNSAAVRSDGAWLHRRRNTRSRADGPLVHRQVDAPADRRPCSSRDLGLAALGRNRARPRWWNAGCGGIRAASAASPNQCGRWAVPEAECSGAADEACRRRSGVVLGLTVVDLRRWRSIGPCWASAGWRRRIPGSRSSRWPRTASASAPGSGSCASRRAAWSCSARSRCQGRL